ncbi:hypothetical protein HMN09_01142700 [Mycena chlorophos]|uniref:CENP-V/GFA domain-containing protein n=1 Tax=Mycena chlorophos TaxID=658473 RepID=A0A8H6S897_MYCCL|nr:hypothetical protein HMN09_01142700 [Mycena chlorophos]
MHSWITSGAEAARHTQPSSDWLAHWSSVASSRSSRSCGHDHGLPGHGSGDNNHGHDHHSLSSPSMADSSLVKYTGNCHCGNFIFTFQTPEIKEANTCNCSICSKNGYIWVPLTEDRFEVIRGNEETGLTTYEFGKKGIAHKFCPTCGSSVLARTKDPNVAKTVALLVNIRMVQRGINFDALRPGKVWDGASKGSPYTVPCEPVEPSITPVPAGLKVYHGNCHCGAVAFSLLSMRELAQATECNCSICWRDGALWTYPDRVALNLRGVDESLTEYGFASKAVTHGFCKICGVSMYERFVGDGTIAPNVRTMAPDIDLSRLRIGRVPGKNIPSSYRPPV